MKSIEDGERGEEAVGGDEAAVVVPDQQHRPRRRYVLDALDLEPEVVLSRHAVQIDQQRDQLGIARPHVVRGRGRGSAFVPVQREAQKASDEARRREQHLAIRTRHEPPRTDHPVDELARDQGRPLRVTVQLEQDVKSNRREFPRSSV